MFWKNQTVRLAWRSQAERLHFVGCPIFEGKETIPETSGDKRQLVLNKGNERFIFCYEQGGEDELLDVLIDQVKDRRTDFDWFDAAVLSFKLSQHLISTADQLLED